MSCNYDKCRCEERKTKPHFFTCLLCGEDNKETWCGEFICGECMNSEPTSEAAINPRVKQMNEPIEDRLESIEKKLDKLLNYYVMPAETLKYEPIETFMKPLRGLTPWYRKLWCKIKAMVKR